MSLNLIFSEPCRDLQSWVDPSDRCSPIKMLKEMGVDIYDYERVNQDDSTSILWELVCLGASVSGAGDSLEHDKALRYRGEETRLHPRV